MKRIFIPYLLTKNCRFRIQYSRNQSN